MRRGGVAGLLALAVAVVVVAGVVVHHHNQSPTVRLARFCAGLRSPAGRGATVPVTTGRPRVVVLGDSYSSGFALAQPREAWPTALGRLERWEVYVDGLAGTGMVNGGLCAQPYLGRVPQVLSHHPARVVVQVGLNDTGASPAVETAVAVTMLSALAPVRQVDVVGPPLVPHFAPSQLARVDAALRGACVVAHRRYISALAWRLPYLSDGVHLTPAGHVAFARLVARALAEG